MPLLLILLAVGAAVIAHSTALFAVAVVNAVLAFWANGVLSNFGPGDVAVAPNWAATVSLLTALASVGLGVGALVIR